MIDNKKLFRLTPTLGRRTLIASGPLTKQPGTMPYRLVLAEGDEESLTRLEKLKGSLKPNGALWVIRPKGRPEISEQATMAAGKAAGLVDVKVVAFSTTHTAEKFVIPVKARAKP